MFKIIEIAFDRLKRTLILLDYDYKKSLFHITNFKTFCLELLCLLLRKLYLWLIQSFITAIIGTEKTQPIEPWDYIYYQIFYVLRYKLRPK